jgi:signal transduction histidine kinase
MSLDSTDQEPRTRLRQQEILATLGAAALRGGPLDELFQDTCRLVAQGLDTGFAKLMEYRPQEMSFLVCAGVGWRSGVVGHARIKADIASPAGYAVKTGQALISNELELESRFETPPLLLEHGIHCMVNVLIMRGQQPFGVLEADAAESRHFDEHDVSFLQAAASLLGMAIERKRIENELAHSHARISEVLESISDAFYSVDHEWRFIYFNRNAEVLWRRRRADVLGTLYHDGFPTALGDSIHETHMRAATERRALNMEALCPALNRWLDVAVYPGAGGLSVYMRDISDRKQAEAQLQAFTVVLEQRVAERTRELAEANARLVAEIAERRKAEAALMQAQRLEAIGQLTGGIAHDFNNLLTAVIGNLELMQRGLTEERTRKQAQAALAAAQRGGTLTRQLLAYARRQHVEPRATDVNGTVTGMRDMLRRSLGGLVTVEIDVTRCRWLAMADPAQLESVVLNLAINARDAMPEGGVVRISTADVAADNDDLPAELGACDYVRIAVADHGMGMPPEVVARAFEPFFTTKEIGQGSGLGLAQVQGVASQFGGSARLRSAVGAGTTVEVYLPRALEAEAREPAEISLGPVPADARVLVVDDEADVRAIAAAFLEEAGLGVAQYGSGAEALAGLAEGYALALVDYGMAGMSGVEFVRQARALHPTMKVIYVTGHANPPDAAAVGPADAVLTKPYEATDLLRAVRRMLVPA